MKDWLEWHRPYDEPGSSLCLRLELVQAHIRRALDASPAGPVQVVSVCAGQGRDLIGVLVGHPRRDDVVARLVELDGANVERARDAADAAGLDDITVVRGDASSTSAYEGAVPADVVLVCGVFGNVVDDDIRATIDELPGLCGPGATVIWTRYPRDSTLLPQIDRWFGEAGFERLALETGEGGRQFGVGVHRLTGEPRPFRGGVPIFTFLDDPDPAGLRQAGGSSPSSAPAAE